MKNYEKYADEIRKYEGDNFCIDFVLPNIMESNDCGGNCNVCRMLQTIWLMEEPEEPEEPEIDWSKVEVDTPIFVRDSENTEWLKKYFAKYENGHVYVWNLGRTSWTAPNDKSVSAWSYAKLAEDEKESEVDWSKVEVDTPILVRVFEGERWKKRYFAKVENGDVYAWTDENTSLTAHGMTKWSYAKLAESEE